MEKISGKRGESQPKTPSTVQSFVPGRLTSSTAPIRMQRDKNWPDSIRDLASPAPRSRAKNQGPADRIEEGEDELDSPISNDEESTFSLSHDEDRPLTSTISPRKSPRHSDLTRRHIPLTSPDPLSSTVLALGLSRVEVNVTSDPPNLGAFTLTQEDVVRFRKGNFKKHAWDRSKRASDWSKLTIHDAATRRLEEVLGTNKSMGSLATCAYNDLGDREWFYETAVDGFW